LLRARTYVTDRLDDDPPNDVVTHRIALGNPRP